MKSIIDKALVIKIDGSITESNLDDFEKPYFLSSGNLYSEGPFFSDSSSSRSARSLFRLFACQMRRTAPATSATIVNPTITSGTTSPLQNLLNMLPDS